MTIAMVCSLGITAFADNDRYDVEGQFVQELYDMTDDEVVALSFPEAVGLFEEAYGVSADNYNEGEVRTAIRSLAFFLKLQPDGPSTYAASDSTTGSKYYTGDIGLAWVRDTVKSPLTIGETMYGYTFEVDHLSRYSGLVVSAANHSKSTFETIRDLAASGASSTKIGNIVKNALSLSFTPLITAIQATAVIICGWNAVQALDATVFNNKVLNMSDSQKIKITLMWSPYGVISKTYNVMDATTTYSNPLTGLYGYWHPDVTTKSGVF